MRDPRDMTGLGKNMQDLMNELKDSIQGNLRLLFHGTTRVAAQSIRNDHFFRSSGKGHDLGPGIYLGTSLQVARDWADGANDEAEVYFEIIAKMNTTKWVAGNPIESWPVYDDWQTWAEGYDSIYAYKQWALRSNAQILYYALREFPADLDGSDKRYETPANWKTLIWRDSNITRSDNAASFSSLQNKFQNQLDIIGVATNVDAFDIIDSIPLHRRHTVYVASNRANDGLGFLTTCRNSKSITNQAAMYCMHTDGWEYQHWITIDTKGDTLERFVRERILA